MKHKTVPIVRKPEFQWENLSEHYVDNNSFGTHFLNSMHVIFPDGEKFFVRSVRKYIDQIQDPELKERLKAFIGQEMHHMNQHRTFWNFLKKQSPALEVFENFYRNAVYTHFEDFMRSTEYGNKLALSITAALEHFTAIFGEAALQNNCELLSNIPGDMKDLLKWHAAEELEHKSVAFDLLQEVDDSYLLRVLGMIYATVALNFFLFTGQTIFMLYDKEIKLADLPGQFVRFLQKVSPLAKGVLENYFDYFRPDFHPDDKDNLFLAKQIMKEVEENQAKKKEAA